MANVLKLGNKIQRKRGRPASSEIRDECRRISALLSSGFGPAEIRKELGLTERQYKYRMKLLRQRSHDASEVWPKYVAKVDTRYRQFEAIRQKALQKNDLNSAMRAIENMRRLDIEVIQVGQELGEYDRQARKSEVTISAPSLGLFHTAPEEVKEESSSDAPPKDTETHGDPSRTVH